jgi:hypothetical protein
VTSAQAAPSIRARLNQATAFENRRNDDLLLEPIVLMYTEFAGDANRIGYEAVRC